jgi:hypothetical protein
MWWRINRTAAFLSICTCVTGQLMVGFIAKDLICAWRQIDFISTTAVHEVIATFS